MLSLILLGLPPRGIGQGNSLSFTGEQVFRGVMFGEAPVSQLLPEVWGSDEVAIQLDTKEKVKAWDAMKEGVTSWIKQDDPAFMDWFGVEMQSGEHLRVRNALVQGGTRMKNALLTLGVMTQDGDFNADYQGAMACSAVAVCFAAVAVAAWKWVAVVDVAVVVWVAAIAVAIWRWKPTRSTLSFSDDPNESTLFRDELINTLAVKLDSAH